MPEQQQFWFWLSLAELAGTASEWPGNPFHPPTPLQVRHSGSHRSRVSVNPGFLSLPQSSPDMSKNEAATATTLPSAPGRASRACWNCNCKNPTLCPWQSKQGLLELQLQQPYSPSRAERACTAGTATAATLPSICLLYTSPSPRDKRQSRMPSSA